ncbi:hypothetical protein L1987_29090 [Smallanthus sonchifolius]|uniref:Uncharacterized protein n=1 Tax=Smallanthus sonchifolius TaxID=185202 RepID=A0ACB9I0U7_9ASTR|nr:hypothetical protein L1987_29090 [Smallanthus sonchifolius]
MAWWRRVRIRRRGEEDNGWWKKPMDTIISAFELLDTSIEDCSINMKILASRLDRFTDLKREVELKEKASKEAKEEAASSGLDIVAKVEALKQAKQRLKETNDMHARKVYAKRAVLAKDLKELQLRVSGVLNEGRRSLGVSDEMHRVLKMRLTKALKEKDLADKEKIENERLAQEALAFEESQMLKLVEESKRLKQEAVKNSELQDLFKERESVFNILHGDVSDIYQDINLFIDRLDQPVLRQTSSSLTSSLVPGHELQLKAVASNEAPKVTTKKHAQYVNGFVIPENERLLKIPDLALEKQVRNMNESSKVKVEPLVADITEVGHSMSTEGYVASAQTYTKQVAAPLTVRHDARKGPYQKSTKWRKKNAPQTIGSGEKMI